MPGAILAARFPRIAWKYESIAYALTLKHVGVLYQTMYLTATAMGLAPCAIGGGDADTSSDSAGLSSLGSVPIADAVGPVGVGNAEGDA